MKAMRQSFVVISFMACFHAALGFPNGAPVSACMDLTPKHLKDKAPITPQPDSTFSYTIETTLVNGHSIGSGDSATIKLSSNFQGFLIEARQGDSPVGTFDVLGNDNIQTIDCGSGLKNAITHTNPTVKESITATWTAPSDFDELHGSVEFHVTVAETHDTYWVNHVVTI